MRNLIRPHSLLQAAISGRAGQPKSLHPEAIRAASTAREDRREGRGAIYFSMNFRQPAENALVHA